MIEGIVEEVAEALQRGRCEDCMSHLDGCPKPECLEFSREQALDALRVVAPHLEVLEERIRWLAEKLAANTVWGPTAWMAQARKAYPLPKHRCAQRNCEVCDKREKCCGDEPHTQSVASGKEERDD